MAHTFALSPTSTGNLYTSTITDLDNLVVPLESQAVSEDYEFRTLWRAHFLELTTPGFHDPVIDALVAIVERSPNWRQQCSIDNICAKRDQVRTVLRCNPPHGIIVAMDKATYGCYYNTGDLWPYICIARNLVVQWVDAQRKLTRYRGLALTAVLKATIDHELGHWFSTISHGKISVGYFLAMSIPDEAEREKALDELGPQHLQTMSSLATPQALNAPWMESNDALMGEAGNFVEVRSRGGIMDYANGQGK
ncbi:hypothetical protein GALMADRAFT_605663 [Galerina marginata CBS 339.88]|uniref:Uncharacterized protein n=1 Tax=Galerina marginata (strain CBS 339.88) TaxID=685588 RepID=A0A067T549_GALM3|nr:hypothetical protein GALMADRAFT_605663 [Galerina marginata CBS 339.88]